MRRSTTLISQERRLGLFLILPAFATMIAVILLPLLYSFVLSFQNLNVYNPERGREFVGLSNYIQAVTSKAWWMAWLRTVYFVLADLFIGIPLGLAIAILLNREMRMKGLIFAIILFPYVLAPIVNSLIWKLIYDPNYGFLNGILFQLGLISEYIPWLSKPSLAIIMLIIANLWQGTPFAVILFLAGLKAIPLEEYEAASVDGASSLTSFWYITLPHLKPIIYMNVVMKTILTFKVFDIVYALTGGGPGGSTEVVGMLIYRESFEFMKFGSASAMSYLLLLLVVVLVVFYTFAFREETE